jgi:aspartate-semialdehyde dehydrogenase
VSGAPARRIPVAVLGATGAVGQTFVRLLDGHPWFELVAVAASERSAGRRYADATRWIGEAMPSSVSHMPVVACSPPEVNAQIVFSALDANVAGETEEAFAKAGRIVLSNARNHRMDADVPLLIPEVNAGQLALLEVQRRERGWSGAIVTNANCAAIVIAMALAPLHERFGVRQLFVSTMQAVSGAGYPGVPSLDILGNVIPFIAGEEEKIEAELRKLLGDIDGERLIDADFAVSVHANRVPVEHGHTACMSVALGRRVPPEEALEVLQAWTVSPEIAALPSAPERALLVTGATDRPQPRRDVDTGRGMTVVIGRVRADPLVDLRMVAMGHNTVRGAAGASLLNAELMVARGLVEGRRS